MPQKYFVADESFCSSPNVLVTTETKENGVFERKKHGSTLEKVAQELRPRLHRYCARMAGSVIDGEDILQDALMKALEAFPDDGSITNIEGWLFRIAHNTALDFLRRRMRAQAIVVEQQDETAADPGDEIGRREAAAIGLRHFMKLSPAERSSVILMDVIGYSLQEISAIMAMSLPAVKASLHRGRNRLTALGAEEDNVLGLTEEEHLRLQLYVDRFNARDFDAVRDLLSEDVRFDLVNRFHKRGKSSVSPYFTNYAAMPSWRLAIGTVDGQMALISYNPDDPACRPTNFILLEWIAGRISRIRDFYHAGYAMERAEIRIAGDQLKAR